MKTLLLILTAGFFTFIAEAQTGSVGIGTSAPAASAVLDIQSTNRGLLLPRLTNAQMYGIANPAEGLLVYNTDFGTFWGYNRYDSAVAQNVVDSPGSFSDILTSAAPVTGQTFLTTRAGMLRYLVLNLYNGSTSVSHTVKVDLFSGSGYGTLIASSTKTLPNNTLDPITNLDTFYFSGNVAIPANVVRTFRVTCLDCPTTTTGGAVFVIFDAGDYYPNGTRLAGAAGTPTTYDIFFRLFCNVKGWRGLQLE